MHYLEERAALAFADLLLWHFFSAVLGGDKRLGVAGVGNAKMAAFPCEAFVFGGHDGQKPLKTVQSFTPSEDKRGHPQILQGCDNSEL